MVGEIERSDLEAWDVDDLPGDFEDRVMAALDRVPVEQPRSRVPIWIALAAAVVLGVVGVLAASKLRLAEREDGALVVALGRGAQAWPEPGARIDVDGATVRQSSGSVLYEVPPGIALVVATEAGDVRVGGTRFSVEVMEMNEATRRKLMGAGALAMGTIAVAVYVHDGSVTLANDRGEVQVAATQQAFATDATAPMRAGEQPRVRKSKASVAQADAGAKKKQERDEMSARIQQALASRRSAPERTSAPDEGAPKEFGTLNKEYIQEVVREQVIDLLKECYNNALEREAAMSGKIVLEFTIVGDESVGGVVEEVLVGEGTTLLDPELGECVSESMASATFPPPEGGGTVQVTYPFVFAPSDDE
jgi:hypothetical protein